MRADLHFLVFVCSVIHFICLSFKLIHFVFLRGINSAVQTAQKLPNGRKKKLQLQQLLLLLLLQLLQHALIFFVVYNVLTYLLFAYLLINWSIIYSSLS